MDQAILRLAIVFPLNLILDRRLNSSQCFTDCHYVRRSVLHCCTEHRALGHLLICHQKQRTHTHRLTATEPSTNL